MVEMAIISVVLGFLVLIAIPSLIKIRRTANVKICIANLKRIRTAKNMWGVNNVAGAPGMSDLVPTYIKTTPSCPSAGTYTVNDMNTYPECTFDDHEIS